MKKEHISDALNMLDDDILEEVNRVRENKRNHKRKMWWKWVVAAACFVILIYAGVRYMPEDIPGEPAAEEKNTSDTVLEQENSNDTALEQDDSKDAASGQESSISAPKDSDDNLSGLPILTIENRAEGVGYEGLMAYDISELTNGNPWTKSAELDTLPVYRNQVSAQVTENGIYEVVGADADTMKRFLLELGARLGMDTNKLENKLRVTESSYVVAADNGTDIQVLPDMTAEIEFEPSISLPDKYTFLKDSLSYEEVEAVAEYLKNEYMDLLGMENPQVDIYNGDYTFDGEQRYNIAFYEGDGDLTDQIIHYNFKRVTFSCNDEGKLWFVRIYNLDLSDKAGDYPIISADEAAKLLKSGKYITSVPCEMPGMDYVAKVELVYRTGSAEEYFIPYYRFYVEVPEMRRGNGLNTYGAYYVPAVAEEYISDLSVWDGSFN